MRSLHQFQVTFAAGCSQLVKMVSEPEELSVFASYLEDIKIIRGNFYKSKIIHIPGHIIQGRTVSHGVQGYNRRLSST